MIRKCLALSGLLVAGFVNAQNYNVPSYCELGRAHNDLKIEGPQYLLENMTYRFKGDYHFDFSFETRYVDFWDSQNGFNGSDSTNSEMNSYLNITIPQFSRGPIYLWAIEDNGDPFNGLDNGCSYMEAQVQNPPTISKNSVSGGSRITASVNAAIDSLYSKFAKEGDGKPRITFRAQHMDYRQIVESKVTSSKSVTLYPQYSGLYTLSAEVFDGTYKKSVSLGAVHYLGGQPCTTCGQIP